MINIVAIFSALAYLFLSLFLAVPAQAASVDCQAARSEAELSLYLYFPSEEDAAFPAEIKGTTTSPIPAFDASNLDPDAGSTAEYRAAIAERVRRDFCEFDVEVIVTTDSDGTTDPTPSDDRWRVVGIGGDSFDGNLYGTCCENGIARVWADEFGQESEAGEMIDGTLSGANSTLERWANAIAGTASHEAGHSLGAPGNHDSSIPRENEDERGNHVMASGLDAGNITGEDRASDRHFSDRTVEALVANLGFYEQTLSNWDFVNPNPEAADGLTITVLVAQNAGAPEIGSVYDGTLSPWSDPTIASSGIAIFQNETYDRYDIFFEEDQVWDNGDEGKVGAGVEFHVGVGLTENYIVSDVVLTSGGSALGLKPRVVGYTPDGSFDPATGDYHLTLSIPDGENGPLVVSDVEIRHLPRTLDINEMIDGGTSVDAERRPLIPWDVRDGDGELTVAGAADLPVANLAEPRALDYTLEVDPECGEIPDFPMEPDSDLFEVEYCDEGRVLGLFPSARVYVTATVTDPNARYFDRETGEMVEGPLSTRIFIQFPGGIPDLNDNGVDDAIDIETGICGDANRNGVCDSAEPPRYRYAAKLVCGEQDVPSDGRLVKGIYATTVNILNLSDRTARIQKALSLSYPPAEQRPGKTFAIASDTLPAGAALETDCADIGKQVFPDGLPASYIEGYVTIESFEPLDVTGVYSSRDTEIAPPCNAGSVPACGQQKCGRQSCCTEGDCRGAPAISTTLDVERASERIIRPPDAGRMCADLVVTDIGEPDFDCAGGSDACVTRVRYTIANIGRAASGPFAARATLDPAQSVTLSATSEGLLPGEEASIFVQTEPGTFCLDPNCTISTEADVSNKVKECREDNNMHTETTEG